MFDYWVSEVIAERVYQVNEVYFDAGDVVPSVVMPNCYCIKSKNVAHIHGMDIYFSEFPAFTVAKAVHVVILIQ